MEQTAYAFRSITKIVFFTMFKPLQIQNYPQTKAWTNHIRIEIFCRELKLKFETILSPIS